MKIGEDVEKIPAGQFLLDSGLLFEINRKVLHPFGLALEVIVDPDQEIVEGGDATYVLGSSLWDYRDDEEGMVFGEKTFKEGIAKLENFMKEFGFERLKTRNQSLGFIVQHEEKDFIQPLKMSQKAITRLGTKTGTPVTEKDFQKEDQEETNFINSIPTAADGGDTDTEKPITSNDPTSLSIIERNMELRIKAKMKKGVTGKVGDGSATAHDTPAGGPCKNPVVVSEPLRSGGSLVTCSSCGAVLSDPDMKD
jgi:hypothetical protein